MYSGETAVWWMNRNLRALMLAPRSTRRSRSKPALAYVDNRLSFYLHLGGYEIKSVCVSVCVSKQGWRFGVAVTRWSRSTQLLYIEPG